MQYIPPMCVNRRKGWPTWSRLNVPYIFRSRSGCFIFLPVFFLCFFFRRECFIALVGPQSCFEDKPTWNSSGLSPKRDSSSKRRGVNFWRTSWAQNNNNNNNNYRTNENNSDRNMKVKEGSGVPNNSAAAPPYYFFSGFAPFPWPVALSLAEPFRH